MLTVKNNKKNKIIKHASVEIQGLTIIPLIDSLGHYVFENVPSGTYTLVINNKCNIKLVKNIKVKAQQIHFIHESISDSCSCYSGNEHVVNEHALKAMEVLRKRGVDTMFYYQHILYTNGPENGYGKVYSMHNKMVSVIQFDYFHRSRHPKVITGKNLALPDDSLITYFFEQRLDTFSGERLMVDLFTNSKDTSGYHIYSHGPSHDGWHLLVMYLPGSCNYWHMKDYMRKKNKVTNPMCAVLSKMMIENYGEKRKK